MDVYYEIHTLKNIPGEKKERKYVVLRHLNHLSEDEMESYIEASCTLTKADVRGVLTALRQFAIEQLSQGNNFYIPGIGRLSLEVRLDKNANSPNHKLTGKDIFLRGLNFRPEKKFFDEIALDMNFKQSDYTTLSPDYEEERLWAAVSDYLSTHEFLTRPIMRKQFGLSKYNVIKWLTRFIESGRIRKLSINHHYIYMAAK
ncbi:MAG: hypothetical protein ACOYJG_10345 [Prevotella sp.]|jgi:nucleoid DNA-binding protein